MIRPDISCRKPCAVSGLIQAAIAPVMVSLITFTATATGMAEKRRIHFSVVLNGARKANAPVRASRDVKKIHRK